MEKLFELVEPTPDIIDFYNDLWRGENIYKKTVLFKNGIEIDITDYLPLDIAEYSSKDDDIKKYIVDNNTEKFLKTINSVYHTRVNLSSVDWNDECWHIDNIREEGIDRFISKLQDKTKRYEYSFATKVFSFLNEEDCPILDSIAVSLLNEYYKVCFDTNEDRKKQWGTYKNYKEDYKKILEKKNLSDISFKKFDVFLWTYGVVIQNYWQKCGIIVYKPVQYQH
jgi:hypothetical protein